ncbi:MAG: DNA polymerase III subunit gamma/tau [Deltaproteobacteria bacterium]|nr:DNA polymerase III subunit gamma/tau [Deltaproteobacteria bacterium]
MSYLVLARRWRPQTFEEIRGQEHIARALRNAITSQRIAHAYLFTGIRGVGKTSAARVLAKALNCAAGPTPTPCNDCPSCREITDGKSPDVLEIDGASNTGVEDVRRLREAVRYAPVRGPYRVYIIDEVHMLSTAAFNALLKTLEEPPAHVVFIFATTDAHKIPITILSRCQQFDFKRLSPRELMALLADIARAEGIAIDERSLVALAREADGSVRDAQSLLDQVISYAGNAVTYADVRDVLGVVDRECVLGVVGSVLAKDPRRVLERLLEAERFGYDVRRFALDLLDVFRDLAVLKAVEGGEDLVELAPEEVSEVRGALESVSWEETHALFDMLSKGVEGLRTVSRPAVTLEMTLLKMAKLPPLLSLSQVLAAAGDGPVGVRLAARLVEPATGEAAADRVRSELRRVLEGTGAAGPGSVAAPKVSSETPRDRGSMPPPAPVVATASPAVLPEKGPAPERFGAERVWNAILSGVERSNRPFWTVLRGHGRLDSWDADRRLAVVACDDPGQEFLWRPKAGLLTEALAGLAGAGARVELSFPASDGPRGRNGSAESDRARSLKKEALEHPLVREALEIFDGDVEEVRALKP